MNAVPLSFVGACRRPPEAVKSVGALARSIFDDAVSGGSSSSLLAWKKHAGILQGTMSREGFDGSRGTSRVLWHAVFAS
mgnify:CR=1 FL=1